MGVHRVLREELKLPITVESAEELAILGGKELDNAKHNPAIWVFGTYRVDAEKFSYPRSKLVFVRDFTTYPNIVDDALAKRVNEVAEAMVKRVPLVLAHRIQVARNKHHAEMLELMSVAEGLSDKLKAVKEELSFIKRAFAKYGVDFDELKEDEDFAEFAREGESCEKTCV